MRVGDLFSKETNNWLNGRIMSILYLLLILFNNIIFTDDMIFLIIIYFNNSYLRAPHNRSTG